MNPKPNDHGVYSKNDAELIRLELKKAVAEIYIFKVETGWLSSANVSHMQGNMSGFGQPISGDPFPTRIDALRDAAAEIIRHEHSVIADQGSSVNDKQKAVAREIIEWATVLIKGKPQGEFAFA